MTARRLHFVGLLAPLILAACGGAGDSPVEAEGETLSADATILRYNREYIFVSPRADVPLVVPFTFRARDDGAELERDARGWLARGATWDRFLDETGRGARTGGVWRVVPQGDLRVAAGGPAEIETIRFERGERRLRLDLDTPLTAWNQGGDTRFRLVAGRLSIGAETMAGPVLEMLRVERSLGDGWPPGQDFDALFLVSGDSIQLVMADAVENDDEGASYAWTRRGGRERVWDAAEIRWLEVRAFQEARRDVPRRWSFRIPGSEIGGEVEALGFDAVLGPERAGRRAVEIRFSVEGWIGVEGDDEVRRVTGMIRHTQR